MPVKIKICGITLFEDARLAVNLGADAIGFVFDPKSPRYITPKMARRIIMKLPPFVTKAGIFTNEPLQAVLDAVNVSGVDTVQLNGNEPPEIISQIPYPVIKYFPVTADFDITLLDNYPASALLLDTWNKDCLSGGPGMPFTWNIAKEAVRRKKTIILAGRLGETNISEALEEVRPYAVDVCESVEVLPGTKNPQKLGAVIKIVKQWK